MRFLDNGSGPLIQAVRIALQIISLLLPILDLKPDKIRPKVSAILDDESNSLIRQGLIAAHQVVIFAYYAVYIRARLNRSPFRRLSPWIEMQEG